MNEHPLISVITPTYNRATLLNKAIASVLNQSFNNWEYIIVDDGSTDNTKDVVQSFSDQRIRYIYQDNSERSAARNHGISIAKGSYICFLDSDDYYLPDHLQSFHDEITAQKHAKGFYYSGHIEQENGENIFQSKWYDSKYANPVIFAWENLLLGDAVCISRELLLENKFPVQFNMFEDAHVWLRVLSKYPFFQIKKHTVVVLEHRDRSINSVFQNASLEQSLSYIECINDLFTNYDKLISPFISSQMKEEFIRKKLFLISEIGIANGNRMKSKGREVLAASFFSSSVVVIKSASG